MTSHSNTSSFSGTNTSTACADSGAHTSEPGASAQSHVDQVERTLNGRTETPASSAISTLGRPENSAPLPLLLNTSTIAVRQTCAALQSGLSSVDPIPDTGKRCELLFIDMADGSRSSLGARDAVRAVVDYACRNLQPKGDLILALPSDIAAHEELRTLAQLLGNVGLYAVEAQSGGDNARCLIRFKRAA